MRLSHFTSSDPAPCSGSSAPPGGHFEAPSGAHLGIYGKSRSTVDSEGIFSDPKIAPETGEILGIFDPVAVRLERYALQSVARSILPRSQTAKCLRVAFRPSGAVDVWFSPSHQSASFGGLVTCHSVWACPICAAKISERRRLELHAAIKAWEAQGGSVALATLTHGHGPRDPLADLLQREQRALHRFLSGRSGRECFALLGRVGHIRAWECTHGRRRTLNNGWHPHFHLLLFLDQSHPDLVAAEQVAFDVWLNCCQLAGLPLPNRRHGVTLENGSRAAAYVAKMGLEDSRIWGLDAEMTKGHIKRAKDGETPFDLLRSCLVCEDPQGRALFEEYFWAFHGKRQLVWSRGLRERFALDDVSDAELAASQEIDAELLAKLLPDQWRLVIRCNARGELLELARGGDWGPVARFLETLEAMNHDQK